MSQVNKFQRCWILESNILILGLDDGDRKSLDKHYKGNDPPCQMDPEDDRFVLKGPRFNPLVVVNLLIKERGYKLMYNPQQRSIPLKSGSTDDKYIFSKIKTIDESIF